MDPDRKLTDKGEEQADIMAGWLAGQVGTVDAVLTSPFERATATAKVMRKALGVSKQDREKLEELEPDADPKKAWQAIQDAAGDAAEVLVVSHHPLVNELVKTLCGAKTDDLAFHHGYICLIDTDAKLLHWMVGPKLVSREATLKEDGWVTMAGGQHIYIGGDAEEKSAKVQKALASFKPSTKAKQDIADASEKELAKGLGMDRTEDNAPYDLQYGKVAVEVKTLIDNTNDKITMHPESRERKLEAAKVDKLRPYTVVVDKRGPSPKFYYAKGVGSFRLGSMTPVGSMRELRGVLR